jgi:hypothetical protein
MNQGQLLPNARVSIVFIFVQFFISTDFSRWFAKALLSITLMLVGIINLVNLDS